MLPKSNYRIVKKNNKREIVKIKGIGLYKNELRVIEAKMRWIFFNKEGNDEDVLQYNELEKKWKELNNWNTNN